MPNPVTQRSPSSPLSVDEARAARAASLQRHPTLLGVAPAAPIVIGSPSSPSSPGLATASQPAIALEPAALPASTELAAAAPASEMRPRTDRPMPSPLLATERIDTPPKHTFEAIALEEEVLPRRRSWAYPAAAIALALLVVGGLGWRAMHHDAAAPPAVAVATPPAPSPAPPAPVAKTDPAAPAIDPTATPAPAAAAKPADHAAASPKAHPHKAKPHPKKKKHAH